MATQIFISVILAAFGSMFVYGFAGRRHDADAQSKSAQLLAGARTSCCTGSCG